MVSCSLEAPPGAQVRLSIVLTNWNTRELLRTCLRSMERHLADPAYEVMVVDNASSDGSADMVRQDYPGVRLFALEQNCGFSRANNIALREARGRYLLVLNSDTEILDQAFERMCHFMDENPQVGALGAQLLNPDRTIQLSCRRFPSYRTVLFHRYSIMTRLFPRNRYSSEYLMSQSGHDHTMQVDWVSGACLLTRREVIEQVGTLDEDFFMYAEDVDWCYRMNQAGWKVVYFPEARIVHHIGKTTRKAPYRMIYQRHRSMWLFYRKHYSHGIVLVDVATAIGIALRTVMMMGKVFVQSLARTEAKP